MTRVRQVNGLTVDVDRAREWQRRAAANYAAKRRRTPVKPVSGKRRVEAAVYRQQRTAFLDGKTCARCGTSQRLTVHHMQGRVGDLYLDESKWLPLCVDCHGWATDHPHEAIEQGYSLPRIRRAA